MPELKLPDLGPMSKLDRFNAVETLIGDAEANRFLADLPSREGEFLTSELIDARVRTIRTRLKLLGYLNEDNGKGTVDEDLKEAVRLFQTEAKTTIDDFEIDEWVGSQTWTALCELVGFEDDTNLERWMDGDKMGPALMRAARLRFSAVGCFPDRKQYSEGDLWKSFNRFHRVVKVLRLTDPPVGSTVAELLPILFDQDGMVERLGRNGGDIQINFNADTEKEDTRIATNFLVSLAKIELWLLGHDVRPSGVPSESPATDYKEDDPLHDALYKFWRERGRGRDEAKELARTITGRFFAELCKVREEAEVVITNPSGVDVYNQILEQKDADLEKVWEFIKTLGSRLWDGIKRVVRWIVSFFRKAAKAAVNVVRNLARLAYTLATESFRIIKNIVKALYSAVKFVVEPTFSKSDIDHLVIRHDTDFDFQVYVNPSGDPSRTQKILQDFIRCTRMTELGIRVFGLLLGTLMDLLKASTPVLGPFAFVLSCTRIVDRIREFAEFARQYRELMAPA